MRRTEATRVDPVSPVFLCRSGLPPDTAVRGTSRNQDVQCFSEGERRQVQPDLGQDDLSGPTLTPSMRVRSTPAQRYSCVRVWWCR